MVAGQRRAEKEFGHEIPVRDRVQAVWRNRLKAELLGQESPVYRERRPGQGACPQRQDRGALAQLGEPALREVLKALTDPQRVDDPRLRESAYHILHVTQAAMPVPLTELLEALRGPAADVASLVAAHRVLHALRQHQSQKTSVGNPLSISGKEYGPARLTGQLGRLNGHHVD